MNREFIQVDPNTLVTTHSIALHEVPRYTERIIFAPEKTQVKLDGQTLLQTHPNTVLVGDDEEGFPPFGDITNKFLGIEDVFISKVAGQPHRPKNLVALLQQTQEKFDWDIEASVWSAVLQPMSGMNSISIPT